MCCRFIDPTLEHDLTSQTKPWALSPLVATMPYCSRKYVDEEMNASPRRPGMLREMSVNSIDINTPRKERKRKNLKFESSAQRQKYFRDPERRREVEFGPDVSVSVDNLGLVCLTGLFRRSSRPIFVMAISSLTHHLLSSCQLVYPLICCGIGISTRSSLFAVSGSREMWRMEKTHGVACFGVS